MLALPGPGHPEGAGLRGGGADIPQRSWSQELAHTLLRGRVGRRRHRVYVQ